VLSPELEPTDPWLANMHAGATLEESFQRIFEQHYPLVFDFFRRRRFTIEESHDLAQDTFINVLQGLRIFRGEARFNTWLVRVALNVWHNELRRRSAMKRQALEIPLEGTTLIDPEIHGQREVTLPVEDENPLKRVLDEERRETLHRAVNTLPPQMRRCVLLRINHDLKYHEIAQVTRLSIQTVRSHLHQARQQLKQRLGDYFLDSGFPEERESEEV
jgi:RNA polymerase sigma-70 factor, ECF subfamily